MLNLKVGDFVKSSKDGRKVFKLPRIHKDFQQKYKILIVHNPTSDKTQYLTITDSNTTWQLCTMEKEQNG